MSAYTQFGYGGYAPPVTQIMSPNEVLSPQSGDGTARVNVSPAISPTTASGDCRAPVTSSATLVTSPNSGASAADLSAAPLSPDTPSQNSNVGGGASSGQLGTSATGITSGTIDSSSVLSQVGPRSGSSCCENGRPIMTDPVSGQTVCSCQYDSARLALSSYPRLPATNVGVYGTAYPSTDQNPYQSIGVESSAFYSPLGNPYSLKDTTSGNEMTAWTSAGLQPTTGYYSYDPMSAYGYGASYDLAARRKNATRESTATLKAWLNEHKKNPYPTKGEKIMLAIITKMTLTQVSTWFANARRRLKKENKMTWEPKNRTDDDDEALVSDDEKEKELMNVNRINPNSTVSSGNTDFTQRSGGDHRKGIKSDSDFNEDDDKPPVHTNDVREGLGFSSGGGGGAYPHAYHPYQPHPAYYQPSAHATLAAAGYNPAGNCVKNENNDPKNQLVRGCGVPIPATKPKIWSLADTIAHKTPPPPPYMAQHQLDQQLNHQIPHQPTVSHVTTQPQHQEQQQQQQHHHHPSPPIQANRHHHQQFPMMNDFSGPPYYRVHTTTTALPYGSFPGVVTTSMNSINCSSSNNSSNDTISNRNNTTTPTNNNNNNSSSSSNGSHMPLASTDHLLAHQQQQQQQLQQHQLHIRQGTHYHHPSTMNQRGMGFPEAQPDTPPQTPPNMKMPSVATKLLFSGTQVPMTATYSNSNNASSQLVTKAGTPVGFSLGSQYSVPESYGTQLEDYSPRDENSSNSSFSSSSPCSQPSETNFKPLIKW